MATICHLASTTSAHAWNGDHSKLAISPNDSEIWIFTGCDNLDSSSWKKKWILKEHELPVASLDWHPVTGRLVSVGHDRNAFVWVFDADNDRWTPQVVVLHISKAALDVKWSLDGSEFAVASASKQVSICRFDPGSNWWISSVSKKAKSTVTSVAWHPSGQVVAAGSTDFKCRVISAWLPSAAGAQPPPPPPVFGPLPEFGTDVIEFEQGRVSVRVLSSRCFGVTLASRVVQCTHTPSPSYHHSRRPQSWVLDCAWAPSGGHLAFITHDCHLHVATFHPSALEAPALQSVRMPGLPAARVLWLSERAILTAGHQPTPELFTRGADGQWRYAAAVELQPASAAKAATTTSFGAAKAMFAGGKNAAASSGPASAGVRHSGAVTSLQPCARRGEGAVHVLKRAPYEHDCWNDDDTDYQSLLTPF